MTVRLQSAFCLAVISAFAAAPQRTAVFGYKVVHVYPHDPTSYTQGLEYRGGYLYEGTGLNGRSKLRKVELDTGKVLRETALDANFFGEGITLVDRRIIQLTWQTQRGFAYNRETFRL